MTANEEEPYTETLRVEDTMVLHAIGTGSAVVENYGLVHLMFMEFSRAGDDEQHLSKLAFMLSDRQVQEIRGILDEYAHSKAVAETVDDFQKRNLEKLRTRPLSVAVEAVIEATRRVPPFTPRNRQDWGVAINQLLMTCSGLGIAYDGHRAREQRHQTDDAATLLGEMNVVPEEDT